MSAPCLVKADQTYACLPVGVVVSFVHLTRVCTLSSESRLELAFWCGCVICTFDMSAHCLVKADQTHACLPFGQLGVVVSFGQLGVLTQEEKGHDIS